MNLKLLLLLVAFTFFTLIFTFNSEKSRVLIIGDSQLGSTALGADIKSYFSNELSSQYDLTIIGCAGSDARTWVRYPRKCFGRNSLIGSNKPFYFQSSKISTYLNEINPEIVIVELGTNSLFPHFYHERSYKKTDEDYRNLAKQIAAVAKCYWISPFPKGKNFFNGKAIKKRLSKLKFKVGESKENGYKRKIAKAYARLKSNVEASCIYIDSHDFVKSSDIGKDQLHFPTKAGSTSSFIPSLLSFL